MTLRITGEIFLAISAVLYIAFLIHRKAAKIKIAIIDDEYIKKNVSLRAAEDAPRENIASSQSEEISKTSVMGDVVYAKTGISSEYSKTAKEEV